MILRFPVLVLGVAVAVAWVAGARADDPLPSWHEGPAKAAIMAFVARVTDEDGADFVAAEARIAAFDNDGTLWSEQPLYFQFLFAIDRLAALAPQHPEWREREPFKSALARDIEGVLASGSEGLSELLAATYVGMTEAEFREAARSWIETARHPRFDRPFDSLVYQPMLELLDYLRGQGFKNYIVSGGSLSFMRAWAPEAYGIPPERIIGSYFRTRFELRDGKPVLMRLPEVGFFQNEGEKPVGINRSIGRRPIAAFGNSDGDLQMLQWTMAGEGARFALLVHHTDDEREWAYARESEVGRLDKALDEARAEGWTVVDMKRDWRVIYPFESR